MSAAAIIVLSFHSLFFSSLAHSRSSSLFVHATSEQNQRLFLNQKWIKKIQLQKALHNNNNNNNNKKERVFLTNKKKNAHTYPRSATVYSRVNLSASSCALLSCATPSRRSRGTSRALFVTFRSVSACSRRRIPSSRRSHFPRKNRSACRSKSKPFFGTRRTRRRRFRARAATRTGASLGLCPCASCVLL